MKLLSILGILLGVQLSAHTEAQITYTAKDVSLETVFRDIGKQYGYNFFSRPEDLALAGKISIAVANVNIDAFMKKCLERQPLDYSIEGKNIFVSKLNKKNGTVALSATSNTMEVVVRVTNQRGEGLEGISVQEKGKQNIVSTTLNGTCRIKVAPQAVLAISAINIIPIEIAVGGKKEISVTAQEKTGVLNEVQVIAYGKVSQKLNPGNVATVKGEEIEGQPVSNPLLALQGKVPGLYITQSTGVAGGGVVVRIQGENSIRSGNDPLIVVDGVPYLSQMPATTFGSILGESGKAPASGGGYGNPLNYINPSDIESISILKDADATAIYGSRAANGAILITTKKGKPGTTKVSINGQFGWSQITNKIDLLSTKDYLGMRREALMNDNVPISETDYDINGTWDTTRQTDWQEELIGQTARFTNLTASVSGGYDNLNYLLSATFRKQTSVFSDDYSDNTGVIHFNVNSFSNDKRFRLQLTASYLVDKNRLPQIDLTNQALTLPPNAPALSDPQDNLNWALTTTGKTTWRAAVHPLTGLVNEYKNNTDNLISNAVVSYRILPQLELKVNLGYNLITTDEFAILNSSKTTPPEFQQTLLRVSQFSNNRTQSWIAEPQVTYSERFNKLQIDALIGAAFQQNEMNGEVLNAAGFISDQLMKDIRSAATIKAFGSEDTEYKYSALFGRLVFNYDNKYIVNLTGRRDGSSRFGDNNKLQSFGAIGIAWLFTEEKFFKGLSPALSFGKLRASYGTTGNDQIGNYNYLNLYTPISEGNPYQGITGLEPAGLTNPYLEWEKTKKLQAGIDLGFLNDRLNLTATFVRNRSSNQLLEYNLPTFTGFRSVLLNFPATVQNKSWEFSLTGTIVKNPSFTWTMSANLTIPENKLLSFPNLESSTYASTLVIGQPLGVIRLFKAAGMDPQTGEFKAYDRDGHATFYPDFMLDRTVFLDFQPRYFGGLYNSTRYKKIELDFQLQFREQQAANIYYNDIYPGTRLVNQPTLVLNRWRYPGDTNPYPAYTANFGATPSQSYFNLQGSDEGFSYDASFIRLKSVSLAYYFNFKPTVKTAINGKLFVQAQNILTITNYAGMDPEVLNPLALPPLKTITVGFQLNL